MFRTRAAPERTILEGAPIRPDALTPTVYSMISSARPRRLSGISSPRALAVIEVDDQFDLVGSLNRHGRITASNLFVYPHDHLLFCDFDRNEGNVFLVLTWIT
jgi:hypothetical protein